MSRPFSYNDENFTVIDHNNKCYFTNKNAIGASVGKYIYGTFMLKDI